ncbi:MAG: hypothetical protein KC503_04760, partial [Myxococcales bacterium]|nr:hypothetical protein [Myxococcales bacterium]
MVFQNSYFLFVALSLACAACAGAESQVVQPDVGVVRDITVDTQLPDIKIDPVDTSVDADSTVDTFVDVPPAGAIHVSPVGTDSSSCGLDKNDPCQTLTRGIDRAASYQPPRPVAAAGGTYSEVVRLKPGVDILGGYNASFVRGGPGNTKTVIRGQIDGGQAVGLWASAINQPTKVEQVTIEAPDANGDGKSSYGVYADNAPGLHLADCEIKPGRGAAGMDGANQSGAAPNGTRGTDGKGGGQDINNPEPIGCPAAASNGMGDRGPGAPASVYGSLTCRGKGGDGGQAGVDYCAGLDGGFATGAGVAVVKTCTTATFGQGGSKGVGGDYDDNTCATVKKGENGFAGCDGKNGTAGSHGAGGSGGTLVSGYYQS